MHDDLEDELGEWARLDTPPVDGAFANRLETSLRHQMLDEPARAARPWLGAVLRPGVVVMAIVVLVLGFAYASRGAGDAGLADGSDTTQPIPTTSVIDLLTTTTTTQGLVLKEPPLTGTTIVDFAEPSGTTVPAQAPSTTQGTFTDQTTLTSTTVPVTTGPPTTDERTIPPLRPFELSIQRDGRQVVVTWAFERADVDSIVGWVLIASVNGDGDIVASSRDVATRTLTGPLTDLDQSFRVEGVTREGRVVVTSNEVQVSRGE